MKVKVLWMLLAFVLCLGGCTQSASVQPETQPNATITGQENAEQIAQIDDLTRQVAALQKANEQSQSENDALQAELEKLKSENDELKAEAEKLKSENDALKADAENLKSENNALREGEKTVVASTSPTQAPTPSTGATLGQKNALSKAGTYLKIMAFSYQGLMDQLIYEGFSEDEAKYAADNCGADWYEQAAKKAKSYLEFMSFSKSGLIDQLEFEGFTNDQATYGAEAVGY